MCLSGPNWLFIYSYSLCLSQKNSQLHQTHFLSPWVLTHCRSPGTPLSWILPPPQLQACSLPWTRTPPTGKRQPIMPFLCIQEAEHYDWYFAGSTGWRHAACNKINNPIILANNAKQKSGKLHTNCYKFLAGLSSLQNGCYNKDSIHNQMPLITHHDSEMQLETLAEIFISFLSPKFGSGDIGTEN